MFNSFYWHIDISNYIFINFFDFRYKYKLDINAYLNEVLYFSNKNSIFCFYYKYYSLLLFYKYVVSLTTACCVENNLRFFYFIYLYNYFFCSVFFSNIFFKKNFCLFQIRNIIFNRLLVSHSGCNFFSDEGVVLSKFSTRFQPVIRRKAKKRIKKRFKILIKKVLKKRVFRKMWKIKRRYRGIKFKYYYRKKFCLVKKPWLIPKFKVSARLSLISRFTSISSYWNYVNKKLYNMNVNNKYDDYNVSLNINNYSYILYLKYVFFLYTKILTDWFFVNINHINNVCNINIDFFFNFNRISSFYNDEFYFTNWFFSLSFFKDPTRFSYLIIDYFSFFEVRRHNPIFRNIVSFLQVWFISLNKKLKIKGYSIFFKGKLGKVGSVRKSVFFFRNGLCSLSNNSLRFNQKRFVIITVTGVVGVCINIFF